jgi:integrase
MLWQGLRPTEALALTKDDVDLGRRILFIRQGKSRAARRELYLVPAAAALLEHRMARPYDFIFPGWRRCLRRWEHNGQAYTYSGLINAHKEVFAALNRETVVLEPFDMYSLRHTFATRFYEATKDLDKLARILGHGNLATVRRYVNPTRDDLRAAMKLFEASQRTDALEAQRRVAEAESQATIH